MITATLLGPILLAQGRSVRANTPSLPEPPGPRTGIYGAGRTLRLLLLGDSSAAGVGAESQSQALLGQLLRHLGSNYRVEYRLEAQTGARTADALGRLNAIEPQAFDVVFTALGVNDVTAMRSTRQFMREQARLVTTLKRHFSDPLVVMSGLPPMQHFPVLPQPLRRYLGDRAAAFSDAAARVAAEHGAVYLPFDFPFDLSAMATDGFHPGPGAYAIWGEAGAQAVVRSLAPAAANRL